MIFRTTQAIITDWHLFPASKNIVALLGVTVDGEVITEVCDFDLVPDPSIGNHGLARKTLSLMQNLKYGRDIARA